MNVFINGSCSFPERARSYGFNHTRSIAEKEKEYTESHKIDELYEFSNDSSRDLKDQQSRELRRIRTTCPAVYL